MIIEFEDILEVDKGIVIKALKDVSKEELVKALYIVSPECIKYFEQVYPEINFVQERQNYGSIPIEEALKANQKLLDLINDV